MKQFLINAVIQRMMILAEFEPNDSIRNVYIDLLRNYKREQEKI